MPVLREVPSKLNLILSNPESTVYIKIDCYNGTTGGLSFTRNLTHSMVCGSTQAIDKVKNLKARQIVFNGAFNNPLEAAVKVRHTIWEEGGKKLVYTFPINYTGNPAYDESVINPSYEFRVNFI